MSRNHGNHKANFGNRFRGKLRGIRPSASRDCSTYQFDALRFRNWSFNNKFRIKLRTKLWKAVRANQC